MGKGQNVFLTGPPDEFIRRKLEVSGFYTEEVRDSVGGKRTGFQVVTIDGKRATLASIQSKSSLKVGNYGVEITEFENSAIPAITHTHASVLIIDEIGKMELYNSKFKSAVESAFSLPNTVILATVPIPKGKPIPFVEKIKNSPNSKLFTVNRDNRDSLSDEVITVLIGA